MRNAHRTWMQNRNIVDFYRHRPSPSLPNPNIYPLKLQSHAPPRSPKHVQYTNRPINMLQLLTILRRARIHRIIPGWGKAILYEEFSYWPLVLDGGCGTSRSIIATYFISTRVSGKETTIESEIYLIINDFKSEDCGWKRVGSSKSLCKCVG